MASRAPNMPQQGSVCPHPQSPTHLLPMRNLALRSFLAPSTTRTDGGALGDRGGRILKFPIKLAWFLCPHIKKKKNQKNQISGNYLTTDFKPQNKKTIFSHYWQQHRLYIRAHVGLCMNTPFSPHPTCLLPPWSWNKLKTEIYKIQSLSMPKQRKSYWKSLFLK